MEKVSLSEFWELLNKHDWWHMYSDDGRVDRAGAANMDKLTRIAGQDKAYIDMLIGFRNHNFSGKPWNSEQAPKPEKPTEA